MMKLFGFIIATFLTSFSHPVLAWDGVFTGKVAQIDLVSSGTNYGFRVYLENLPAICTGGPNWAYINSTEDNYQAIASALLLAYSSGKTVTIYSNLQSTGYCKIEYVTLRPPT